jgi:formylglycine-generating enzyme required for sulfatase activity
MVDALLGFGVLAYLVWTVPMAPALDPGPSDACPRDMRLVEGKHSDVVSHLCLDPRKDTKDTHCFSYWEDMTIAEGTATDVRVCMDQYEAPNIRGSRPYVMKSFEDAERFCGERHKRTCTEQEWELACEGGEYRPLAYGWHVDRSICNSNKQWIAFDVTKLNAQGATGKAELDKLWQGAPSGQFTACASRFGVFDMMGNVEEWVRTRKGRKYPGALKGGFWAKPWTGCRGTNDAHEPTFVFYETGFRCCADADTLDADGKPKKKNEAN